MAFACEDSCPSIYWSRATEAATRCDQPFQALLDDDADQEAPVVEVLRSSSTSPRRRTTPLRTSKGQRAQPLWPCLDAGMHLTMHARSQPHLVVLPLYRNFQWQVLWVQSVSAKCPSGKICSRRHRHFDTPCLNRHGSSRGPPARKEPQISEIPPCTPQRPRSCLRLRKRVCFAIARWRTGLRAPCIFHFSGRTSPTFENLQK